MIIYMIIFLFKIIENTISTLRLIVVANGKKKIGAILQGIVSSFWILTASIVLININKDIFNVLFFCLGSIIGSYLGSLIEEKLALGDTIITCITNNSIIRVMCKRKSITNICYTLKKLDKNCIIFSEKINKL